MSKPPKRVPEGAKWVSRKVLSTDNDNVDHFSKSTLEHIKKCKHMILSKFEPLFHIILNSFLNRNQWFLFEYAVNVALSCLSHTSDHSQASRDSF